MREFRNDPYQTILCGFLSRAKEGTFHFSFPTHRTDRKLSKWKSSPLPRIPLSTHPANHASGSRSEGAPAAASADSAAGAADGASSEAGAQKQPAVLPKILGACGETKACSAWLIFMRNQKKSSQFLFVSFGLPFNIDQQGPLCNSTQVVLQQRHLSRSPNAKTSQTTTKGRVWGTKC